MVQYRWKILFHTFRLWRVSLEVEFSVELLLPQRGSEPKEVNDESAIHYESGRKSSPKHMEETNKTKFKNVSCVNVVCRHVLLHGSPWSSRPSWLALSRFFL